MDNISFSNVVNRIMNLHWIMLFLAVLILRYIALKIGKLEVVYLLCSNAKKYAEQFVCFFPGSSLIFHTYLIHTSKVSHLFLSILGLPEQWFLDLDVTPMFITAQICRYMWYPTKTYLSRFCRFCCIFLGVFRTWSCMMWGPPTIDKLVCK